MTFPVTYSSDISLLFVIVEADRLYFLKKHSVVFHRTYKSLFIQRRLVSKLMHAKHVVTIFSEYWCFRHRKYIYALEAETLCLLLPVFLPGFRITRSSCWWSGCQQGGLRNTNLFHKVKRNKQKDSTPDAIFPFQD